MEDIKTQSPSFLDQLQEQGSSKTDAVLTKSWHERAIEFATVALLIMVLLAPLMTYNELPLTGEGSSQRQIGYLLILALAIYGARPAISRWRLIAMPWPILLAISWCWVSLAWAIAPDIAVRRLLLTTVVVWTTFLVVQQAGYRSTLNVVRVALVVALVANYAVVFLDPATGIHMMTDSAIASALIGNWRGFLVHKNFAGATCAITILLFLFDAKKIPTVWRILVILLSAYFMYRTQSKTSGGMTAIALLAGWIYQFYSRRFRMYAIPAIAIAASLGGMALSAYKDILIFNYLAPSAFTGRGYIWGMLVRYAGDNLGTGSGFGSFWNIGPYSPVYQYGSGMLTQITVGHNGYLDLLVTVGLPGLVIAVFALIIWPIWKLLADQSIKAEEGALISAMLIFCMGHNVTESSLLSRDALVGLFMVLAVAFVCAVGGRKVRSPKNTAAGDDLMRSLRKRRHASPPVTL
ncbi:O-antigen ligase family protein [Sphingobium sp. AR-3-1]|jgi:O-antigen ligase|uniref:O-antigen ligase family protein n=1 Tax=Sphingobium psychrophilum TaxID=2728834 RepID=A0A7X9ZW30_9SPHN|nr:O-antigen ligase family protein [Sphingobium psychrophilum]NML13286.1 O-antigen ligase family protein [Sphingobium psychrophilum]|tara:strand:- start:9592 stop:10983 length:1392 start_codon:yes stop_codon:yes gene_type:complete